MTDNIAPFPARDSNRVAILKAVLLPLDTGNMETTEVIAACEAALPNCTATEIRDALRA